MEIPVIGRVSGFESELNRLQNLSLISRVFDESIQVRTFWTLGALVLALLATLTRFKLLIFTGFRKGTSVISQPLLHHHFDDDETESSESEDDEDSDVEDEDCSSLSSEEDNFRVAGFGNLEELFGQNRKLSLSLGEFGFSWADFVNGSSSVVRSWEGAAASDKATVDAGESSSRFQIPALSMPSPAVMVSAGIEKGKNVALRVFDTRVGRQIPQMFAEMQPCRKKVPDGDGEVIVRDIRKIGSPVESVTESWWESDGEGEMCWLDRGGGGGGSVVSRCRNAVFGYLF